MLFFFIFSPNDVPLDCCSAVCGVGEVWWQALSFWWLVGVDKEELAAAGIIVEEHGRNPVNAEPLQSLKADASSWREVMTEMRDPENVSFAREGTLSQTPLWLDALH